MSMIDAGVGIVLLWLAWQGFSRGLIGSAVWIALLAFTPLIVAPAVPFTSGMLSMFIPDMPDMLRQPVATMITITIGGILLGVVAGMVMGVLGKIVSPIPGLVRLNQATGVVALSSAGVLGLGMGTLLVSSFLDAEKHQKLDATIWGGVIVPHLEPLSPLVKSLLPVDMVKAPCDVPTEVFSGALASASPTQVSAAAQMLLSAMPAQAGAASVMSDANMASALPFFEAAASGSGTQNLSVGQVQAAAGVLKSMLGCPGPDGQANVLALPNDASANAAKLFLEAAAGGARN